MQQINLFVPELQPKKDWLSSKYLSVILLSIIVLMSLIHAINVNEVKNLEEDLEEKALVVKALELELDQSRESTRPSSRAEIEENISKLQRQIDSRERLAALINGQTLDGDFSFHSAMVAMAKQSTRRIAIDHFTFSRGGKYIEFQGEGLRSYDVPGYLNKLRQEKIFQRSRFGLVRIGNIKQSGNVEFSIGYDENISFSQRIEE